MNKYFLLILNGVFFQSLAMDKLNEILSQLNPNKVLEFMILKEKRKILEEFANEEKKHEPELEKQQETDKEAHFYQPKKLKELTDEDKKTPVGQRVSAKYIGDIPTQIRDLLFYFSNHQLCKQNNIKIHNRLLLHGNPGSGKTYLTKVVAEELGVSYLSFPASFFGDKYIGESSRKIRRAFEVAKTTKDPLLIFIDEVDAIAARRNGNTHNEHRATLITLLTEMQDLQNNENVYIVSATNDLRSLDPAIKDRFGGALAEIKDLTIDQRAILIEKLFNDDGVRVEKNFVKRVATILAAKECDRPKFSNRDIENLIKTSLLKKFADCQANPAHCKQHVCKYMRQAIESTGKDKGLGWFKYSYEFCEGI